MKREPKVHYLKQGFFELTLCGTDGWHRSSPVTSDPKLVTCLLCRRLMKKEAR